MSETLIEAVGLSVGYGKMAVVRDVDLHVDAGEVVALLGANGAGKTTTLLSLAGELTPLQGEVRFLGEPTTAPMHTRCRQGLGFLTEERSVIMDMSVADNLKLAGVAPSAAYENFPQLERLMGRRAGLCSGGEQQMLALARALGRDPKVLLADELSLGLAPLVVSALVERLRAIRDELGTTLLVVEQNAQVALEMADHAYVMENGRVVLDGPPQRLREHQDIREFYLGTGEARRRSYRDVKQYRRSRRWYG